MELNFKNILFDELHDTVIDGLKQKGVEASPMLRLIGLWLLRLLNSDVNKMYLRFPEYKKEYQTAVQEYVYYFITLTKLLSAERAVDLKNCCLFDIFWFRLQGWNNENKPLLEFVRSDKEFNVFEKNTVINNNQFTPVFNIESFDHFGKSKQEALNDLFNLFSAIRRKQLIKYPVLFDFHSAITLTFTKQGDQPNKIGLVHVTIANLSPDELDQRLTEFESLDINTCIIYRFPYNSGIPAVVRNEYSDRSKYIDISFNSRFCYEEIPTHGIMVTPHEIDSSFNINEQISRVSVIKTNHSIELYNSIKQLSNDWSSFDFNPFKTPYAIKWLLFIHPGESVDYWQDYYQKTFVEVNGKLLSEINVCITEVLKTTWINDYFSDKHGAYVHVPDYPLYQDSIISLRKYLVDKLSINIVEDIAEAETNKIIIIDPFNAVSLIDIAAKHPDKELIYLLPDFVFFNYCPFLPYQILKYYYDALILGSRIVLDPNFTDSRLFLELKKQEYIQSCRTNLKDYKNRFNSEVTEEVSTSFMPEIEFEENEVIDIFDIKEERAYSKKGRRIKIQTTNDKEYTLGANAPVLIKAFECTIKSKAFALTEGCAFIPISEVTNVIDQDRTAEIVASVSERVLNWKALLAEKNALLGDVYQHLQARGLSIKPSTFEKSYISDANIEVIAGISIPRKKRDWEIVCDFLSIREVNDSWRNIKCRGNLNKLKKAYSEIIQLLINEESFGINVDEDLLVKVAQKFESITGFQDSETDRLANARAIINMITQKIELMQVRNISSYEQTEI